MWSWRRPETPATSVRFGPSAPNVAVAEWLQAAGCEPVYVSSNLTGHPNVWSSSLCEMPDKSGALMGHRGGTPYTYRDVAQLVERRLLVPVAVSSNLTVPAIFRPVVQW